MVLRYIDVIVAQANSQRNYLIDEDNADPEKIEVIYNGVDIGPFIESYDKTDLKEAAGIPHGSPIVGIVARLAPQKGIDYFLQAAAKINRVMPDVHFMILGEGIEKRYLELMSQEHSIHNKVHFTGMVKNVSHYIAMFDVAVLASRSVGETFSNAILEYMAAAKPVVSTNVGSIAEQVIDGKTGFLVPSGDPDALADSILKLLNNRPIAEKMGEEGRKLVLEKFTIQRMITKYDSVFTDLAKRAEHGL